MKIGRFAVAVATVGSVVTVAPITRALDAHAAGTVSHYKFSPSPIAPNGTLPANATVAVTVTAEDASNAPVPGAVVYLWFKSGGGTAAVGATNLVHNAQPFTADGSGNVSITYHTASSLPTTGHDLITAQNAMHSPTVKATDNYSYVGVTKYTLKPKPIAATHSLAANQTVSITLTALNGSSKVPGAVVWLYLAVDPSDTPASGSATVGNKTLSNTAQQFTADANGHITITYKAPASLPASGTDELTASNAPMDSTVFATDTYSFA